MRLDPVEDGHEVGVPLGHGRADPGAAAAGGGVQQGDLGGEEKKVLLLMRCKILGLTMVHKCAIEKTRFYLGESPFQNVAKCTVVTWLLLPFEIIPPPPMPINKNRPFTCGNCQDI